MGVSWLVVSNARRNLLESFDKACSSVVVSAVLSGFLSVRRRSIDHSRGAELVCCDDSLGLLFVRFEWFALLARCCVGRGALAKVELDLLGVAWRCSDFAIKSRELGVVVLGVVFAHRDDVEKANGLALKPQPRVRVASLSR